MSRSSTARGSDTGLSLVGPTKVKACKSFLFTAGSFKVENKEHLFDFVSKLYLHHVASKLYPVAKCHSQLLNFNQQLKANQSIYFVLSCTT